MGVIHKASLLVRFIRGQPRKFNKSIMLTIIQAFTLDPNPPWGTLIELKHQPIILFIKFDTFYYHYGSSLGHPHVW